MPLTEQETKIRYSLWACSVKQFVNQHIYKRCMFVNDAAEVAYGSNVQKAVCRNMGIPIENEENFWDLVGCNSVEESIRRKRNTFTNALKSRFMKYCENPDKNSDGVAILPPDPMKMLPAAIWKGLQAALPTVVIIGADDLEATEEGGEGPAELSGQEMEDVAKQAARACVTDDYQRFLLLFGDSFVPTGSETKTKLLSSYMTKTIEAFALVLYVNNYWKYMGLFWPSQVTGTVSTFTNSRSTHGTGTLFTKEARGAAKYEGWSNDGYIFFNRVYGLIAIQRADVSACKEFEGSMRKAFLGLKGSKRKRPGVQLKITNELDDLDLLYAD